MPTFLTHNDEVVHVRPQGWSYDDTNVSQEGEVIIKDGENNVVDTVGSVAEPHLIRTSPIAPSYLEAGCFTYDYENDSFTQTKLTQAELAEYKRWFAYADANWPNTPIAALKKKLQSNPGMSLVDFFGVAVMHGADPSAFTGIWAYPDFVKRLEVALEGGRTANAQTMVAVNPIRPTLAQADKDALDLAAAYFDRQLLDDLTADDPVGIDLEVEWKLVNAYRTLGGIK